MIAEDYVSFETAKLLKEKGFKFDSCSTYYTLHGEVCEIGKSQEIGIAPRPTLQIAMKWLREIYKCCIVVYPEATDDDSSAGCLWGLVISIRLHHQYTSEKLYESYEEACDAAIKYCLENLI